MTHTHQRLPIDARGEPIRNGDDESADERLECAGWDAIEHAPHGCNPFNFLRVRVGEHLGRGGRGWGQGRSPKAAKSAQKQQKAENAGQSAQDG